jgi:16S rRNA G527 N7-methylase RsmG
VGNSLFDQLKKSGLAKKSQVHKARTEKHQQVKQPELVLSRAMKTVEVRKVVLIRPRIF